MRFHGGRPAGWANTPQRALPPQGAFDENPHLVSVTATCKWDLKRVSHAPEAPGDRIPTPVKQTELLVAKIIWQWRAPHIGWLCLAPRVCSQPRACCSCCCGRRVCCAGPLTRQHSLPASAAVATPRQAHNPGCVGISISVDAAEDTSATAPQTAAATATLPATTTSGASQAPPARYADTGTTTPQPTSHS